MHHSLLPWNSTDKIINVPGDEYDVIAQCSIRDGCHEGQANASLIVHRVNTYNALVEALTNIAALEDDLANEYLEKNQSWVAFDEPYSTQIARKALGLVK